jgi:beta-1,4-mannosyltransferase
MLPNSFGAWAGVERVPQGIVHAVRSLRGQGFVAPAVLAYTPAYRNNPYQELLYRGLWQHGVAPVPLPRAHEVEQLTVAEALGARIVLNVHWTNQLASPDRAETEAAHDAFRASVDGFVERGARLVWTLHNRLPHECDHPDLEVELRRWLVDRADLIHVMGADSPGAVADLYPLDPTKIVEVPHPSYDGVYPATIDRDQARWELGVSPDEHVLLMFGGMRPYKNVPLALDALDNLLSEGRRVRLVVAGQLMGEWPGQNELEHRIVTHPATSAHLRRIDEVDVQRYFLGSDVLLLPYTTIMNSGVLLLGATYGLPVVGPSTGEVGELIDRHGLGATFSSVSSPADVAGAVGALLDGDLHEAGRRGRRFADGVSPGVVADQFRVKIVEQLLRH